MSLLFKGRQSTYERKRTSSFARLYFFILMVIRQGVQSLGEMWRTPLASIMTICVLGLSLTLPATLYLVVKNVQQLRTGFQEASEISLFVKQDISEQQTQSLLKRLALYPEIEKVNFISKTAALDEFKALSGFGQALDYLDDNPLPDVVLVTPTARHRNADSAEALLIKLKGEREIETGKLDIAWLERLNAILSLLRESVITIGLLLQTSVTLIIGNTIRLSIMDKKSEIQVMKLVGATNSFIHTPFLWTGIWYGVIGGFIAFISLTLMMWWLEVAVQQVAGAYQTNFVLSGLNFTEFGLLLGVAVGLGFFGSFLSVNRYIKEIEPDRV